MTPHHLLVKAATRKPAHRRPFWIVNQTLIFKDLINKYAQNSNYVSMLTNPQIATEVSLHPFYELKIDAIELFTSPFLPAFFMNLGCTIEKNSVKIQSPVRSTAQAKNLRFPDINTELDFVAEAINNLRVQTFDAPVVGCCAGPFSMTSLLIDGTISNEMPFTKAVMYSREQAFTDLLGKITEFTKSYVQAQIEAGAEAICIHDPLASLLSYEDFERLYMPVLISLTSSIESGELPLIYNAQNVLPFANLLKNTKLDVITIDSNTSIKDVVNFVSDDFSLQGNFDPLILLGNPETIETKIIEHLNNLGRIHGFIGSFSRRIPDYINTNNLKYFVRKYQELSSGYATS